MDDKKTAALLLAITSLYWFTIYAFSPLVSVYADALGASASLVGLIGGCYGLMQVLLRVPAGILSDRTGRRKPFLLAGVIAAFLAHATVLAFPSLAGLMVARLLSGAASAAWVVFSILYAACTSGTKPTAAMARLSVFTYVGQIPANLLGGAAARAWGPEAALILGAAVACAGFALTLRIREPSVARLPPRLGELLRVGLAPRLLLISGIGLLYQITAFATTFGFVPILMKRLGADTTLIGLMSALAALGMMGGSMLAGSRPGRRLSERTATALGMVITLAGTLVLVWARSTAMILLAQAAAGFGGGLCFTHLTSAAVTCVSAEKRGAAMGFFQSVYALGILIGPVLNGVLADAFALETGFLAAAGVAALAALLCFFGMKPNAPKRRLN